MPRPALPPPKEMIQCATHPGLAFRPPARRPPAARRHSRDQIPHTLVLQL